MLYYAYIYPYMTYYIEVWGCAQLNCLLLLQKKIIRVMSFSHYLAQPIHFSFLPFRKIFFLKMD